MRRREEEITSSQESHPLLLGPESVSELVEGKQTHENSVISVSRENYLCLVLTLLYVGQSTLGNHQEILVTECMFRTKMMEV